MKNLVLLFLLFSGTPTAFAQVLTVSGTVVDSETREPLPFATIGVQNTSLGTVSNGNGFFQLKLPEQSASRMLTFSFLGYESKTLSAEELAKDQTIRLKPAVIHLNELIIRPLSPEDYIKRVVKNFDVAYVSDPFATLAYYREKFLENGAYITLTEGVFNTYYPHYQSDTSKNQHQLVLYRMAEDPQKIQFMRETMEKKAGRRKRRAEKKGEVQEEEEDANIIRATFGGPESILSSDIIKGPEPFLDSTRFEDFRYSFGEPISYQGRELITVLFKSRGAVKHLRQSGKIHVDPDTDAIVSIEYSGKFIIPVFLKPALFALGFSIQDPVMRKIIRYQLIGGKWYPDYLFMNLHVGLTKHHLFSKNEKSRFEVEQLIKVNQVMTSSLAEIEPEKRFRADQPLEDQVYDKTGMSWDDINTVPGE